MANPFFDSLLPILRNELTWLPLYVLILVWAIYKFRLKGGAWVLACLITVGLSDLISSHLIKKTICRPRPCHMIEELSELILRIPCGTGYSFTSSHATNHMAVATFIILTGTLLFGKWRWAFLPWALSIGFAQIYVGVHYPVDVAAGFLLGACIAWCTSLMYKKSNYSLSEMSIVSPPEKA